MHGPFIDSLLGWELLFFIIMNIFWVSLYISSRSREMKPRKTAKEPFVSVVIPVYNKAAEVADTIESAIGIDYENKEVIVVNDGSTDGSLDVCRGFEKKGLIRLIDLGRNTGKSNALNVGIKAAKGSLVLTIDADSIISKNALNHMVGYFQDPSIGAVAGVVRVKNEKKNLLTRFQFLEYMHQAFQRLVQGFFMSVMVLPGPISLFKKSAVADAGWFDESTMVEDWDITMKMHKKGYRIVSDKNAVSDTVAPKSVRDWWRQRIRWSRGGIQISAKHHDVLTKSNNKALTRLVFPLHLMWLFVPFVVVPTMVYLLIPGQFAISAAFGDISLLLSTFWGWITASAQVDISMLYRIFDQIIFDFLDPKNIDWVRALGYTTGVAFIAFTYVSIKSLKENFRPRDLVTIVLMPIYWLLLNAVYMYSFALEAAKRKLVW
jgi:cellulose synthase/poly-beta-1,6-N-acetylglucosamine synthase-like glycosyltransferase